jgi:hypothetical protein
MLSHSTYSREMFARGAVVIWLKFCKELNGLSVMVERPNKVTSGPYLFDYLRTVNRRVGRVVGLA